MWLAPVLLHGCARPSLPLPLHHCPLAELNSQFGGFLSGAELFDAAALGVPPAEALLMDPQQRLALQCFSGMAGREGVWSGTC